MRLKPGLQKKYRYISTPRTRHWDGSRDMEITLIYNEIWKEICNSDVKETKPIDTTSLAKWELKDERALALSYLKMKKCMFILKCL